MPEIHLRPYIPADAEPLFQLDRICFSEAFRFTRQQLRACAEAPSAITRIATVDHTLAGFIITHLQRSRSALHAYIDTLDVDPAFRRQGIARHMLADVELHCHLAGATHMALHVHVGNPAAIRFYETNGYKRLGIESSFYGQAMDGSLDALIYSKILGAEPLNRIV